MTRHSRRRASLGIGVAAVSAVLLAACGAPGSQGAAQDDALVPKKPAKPVAITVLDGAGDLVSSQATLQEFAKAHPDLISSISFQSAAAPDVAGKVKAQQTAGAVDISLVLGGPDVLGAAQAQDLLVRQLPQFDKDLGGLDTVQDAGMKQFQDLADGLGVLNRYNPSGPLLAYLPSTVPDVPTTPQELLAWAKAHPGKFSYAQPANSGPGRTFMMSLPYMLGDTDPSDPAHGWDKTWKYLSDLGQYVSSYPSSTTILNQQFGAGQLELVPTIISFDMNNRQNGTWPSDEKVALFQKQAWVSDGHFMMIPKGVSPEVLYVDLQLEKDLIGEKAQAATLGNGTLTTANKNVTTANASPDARKLIEQFGRPDFYPKAFTTGTTHVPLTPARLQDAFDLWQRNIGSKVGG